MFSKSTNKLPKPVEFSLKPEEYLEDIETIAKHEEERRVLYQCIDSKVPPVDPKLPKIEDFLRDSDVLEQAVKELHQKCDELRQEKAILERHKAEITAMLLSK